MSPQDLKPRSEVDRLHGLARKYRTLAALRSRRDVLQAAGFADWPADERRERRAAFRRLAHEFPGALRELELPVATLEKLARAAAEEAAAAEAGAPPSRFWTRIRIEFHELLAEILAAKMWLARRVGRSGPIRDVDLAAFAEWLGREVTREEAEALHHPPLGRVVEIVWRALEERHGLERRELLALVVGTVEGRA